MARERITFPVNLRQNTNDDSTAFGKWFPVPSTSEPMSLKGFAKHLSEHGKLASYDMLVLVLQNIVAWVPSVPPSRARALMISKPPSAWGPT